MKESKRSKEANTKKKILIILGIGIVLLLIVILGIIFFFVINDKEQEETETKTYISYDINEECLNYLDTLDEITYDTLLESEYADTLYLYNTIYEDTTCDEDDTECGVTSIAIEEEYLACLTNIKYVSDKEIDLAEAIADDSSLLDTLNEALLISNVLSDTDLSNIFITRELDITAPELILKEVSITTSDSYDINSFVESCTDDTDKECILSFENEEMASYSEVGEYDITIIASDSSNNTITKTTTLTIKKASTTSTKASSSNNKSSSSANSSSSSSSSGLSSNEKAAQARIVAKEIASSITGSTDLEKITKAAQAVATYAAKGTYTSADSDYKTAYGVFIKGVYTCAGTTRALGMVLEEMGYSWSHANENQYTHQWVIVTMDGQTGWADGQIGMAGYGEHPYAS